MTNQDPKDTESLSSNAIGRNSIPSHSSHPSHISHSSHSSHPSQSPPRDLPAALLFSALFIGATAYYFLRDPATEGVGLLCPTHALTGLHCPACGGQRALHALLHGDILAALSFNAFAVLVLLPGIAYMALVHGLRLWGVNALPVLPLGRWTLLPLGIAALLFAVLRNLPFPPFDWLAP